MIREVGTARCIGVVVISTCKPYLRVEPSYDSYKVAFMPSTQSLKRKNARKHCALPELPYEIWRHIASFVDSHTMRRLYSVNRALFDIVMNERYRTAQIGWNSVSNRYYSGIAEVR